jgi:hypothetical protein
VNHLNQSGSGGPSQGGQGGQADLYPWLADLAGQRGFVEVMAEPVMIILIRVCAPAALVSRSPPASSVGFSRNRINPVVVEAEAPLA